MSTIMAFAVEKTVTLPDGQVIDWMRREAIGEIASPPAPPQHDKRLRKRSLSAFNSTTTPRTTRGMPLASLLVVGGDLQRNLQLQ
ncbi:carboxyl-terminal ase [Cordyceps militaris]|uniref:Carboxyl-terminal ase n=1 Tax=Cordyceps militaris TaxID=73501 RepID=A0A2H4S649_CORMI|nr:carboxyl-terminal ase [Cordyceps militaris]